jgi:hypothetical protein
MPIIILDPEGLDMRMPPSTLTVSDVADSVGRDKIVEVVSIAFSYSSCTYRLKLIDV